MDTVYFTCRDWFAYDSYVVALGHLHRGNIDLFIAWSLNVGSFGGI